MSIEPKTERTDDIAVEERKADRPSSTAEVARDLERSETPSRADAEEEAAATLFPEDETKDFRAVGPTFKRALWMSRAVRSNKRMRW